MTTLVFASQAAWLEEQVEALRKRGLTADCIHAERDRERLRSACVEYLNGRLQLLYVAPERLGVAGFPQMLAKRKPTLIAVEDAHCIVAGAAGHLADYTLLREHLPSLRPAPVLALTPSGDAGIHAEIVKLLGMALPVG